jgi:hypothetical protein
MISGLLVASLLGAWLAPSASVAENLRLLYADDETGISQIYSIDPSTRRVGQITFAPKCKTPICGFADPAPSPNGRHVLYDSFFGSGGGLWVAGADGRTPRRIARQAFRGAAWAPDSRRIAYASSDGLHVVRPDGSGNRIVDTDDFVRDPSWSPDGRSIAFARRDGSLVVLRGAVRRTIANGVGARSLGNPQRLLTWSPDGRWIAYQDGEAIRLVTPDGRRRRNLAGESSWPTWSPDGRRLAVSGGGGIRVIDVRTGRSRQLARGEGFGLAWSPQGDKIAYVLGTLSYAFPTGGEVRTVTLSGRVRTVVAGGGAYTGDIFGLAWTRPPAGIRYRAPQQVPLQRVLRDELVARDTVGAIATDGGRVAYVACGKVFVWTPASGNVVPVDPTSSGLCAGTVFGGAVYTLALAADWVAYGTQEGGNSIRWKVQGTRLSRPEHRFELSGGGCCRTGPLGGLGKLVGSGPLLVFSSWDEACAPGVPGCRIVTTTERLMRVGLEGCACPTLRTEPGPLVPSDVDGGRIVAYGDNAVVLLDADGAQLLSVPVVAAAAQLSGTDLAILVQGQLRHYDARTGALLHTWPLPDVPSGGLCGHPQGSVVCGSPRLRLDDVAHGLAAYVLDGQVHLLRLADGASASVAPARAARFIDSGLVYAHEDRIKLVPFEALPIR